MEETKDLIDLGSEAADDFDPFEPGSDHALV